ncbi:MAG: redoxin domain-containing protein [Prevotella sp.]|uniref:TlpA disulfide reductase family protein n=1 Tax=Hallella sp. TaxID=2980186 RepID=UPI001B4A2FA7|nr:TlpA disulfide reductase family protein [Hallella sp.]MBP6273307.1 redoxin domain-containing protein [Prevotella sp.]MBS7399160.1 redoxin domain-containing protein [Prevotella sp.]MDD7146412.1 TlpA disulfide reductase family protein [Hallella sp.]MDY5925797.1 TlpA disulfide reductase family protein [Hallella sp.]
MKILKITVVAALVMVALSLASCTGKKFQVSGVISDAPDSLLLFENMSLNGPVVVDSVRLGADGSFSFEGEAPTAPEFYRLRIARQIINVAVDSTEHVTVKASYPTMTGSYEVEGSTECSKIRELALMQLNLQAQINAVVQNPNVSYEKEADSVRTILEVYKYKVKNDYIFKEPWRAYAYFALFQTITLGQQVGLIFDPQSKKEDVQAYAAVATSWDTYHPGSERGTNLHNIAIEGMKNVRILQAEQNQTIDASKINSSGVIEVALPDRNGKTCKLTSLKGKVVLLDFHLFASKGSTERIMHMRDLYNKYHAQGFEIYQVSLDPDEHFWKESVAALPWVCVRDANSTGSVYLTQYNVQSLPTFFTIDRNNVLQKRDAQIKDLDAEIKGLLAK